MLPAGRTPCGAVPQLGAAFAHVRAPRGVRPEEEPPGSATSKLGYWLAWRGDRPVGRISAQVDRRHLERYNDATGHFGFLEAVDDPAVFAALSAAEDGSRPGMRRVTGPFSLSINDESGLLVEGFDTPPSMMMGHARPYYGPWRRWATPPRT